jgi:ArsR family transcriptional regulator, arsenate/arsenite/antimonite-responsive transcriptional repressor
MDIAPPPTNLIKLAERLRLLANPKRLQLIHLLMEGVQCNCELGEALDMAPNLISHHLGLLRDAGIVNVERDAVDARWLYYSLNEEALAELNATYGLFFDPERIKPRRPTCGPQGSLVSIDNIALETA